jgi:hypothetical protein
MIFTGLKKSAIHIHTHFLLSLSSLYITFYYTLLVYFYLITIFISKNFKTCTFTMQAYSPRLQKRVLQKQRISKQQRMQSLCRIIPNQYTPYSGNTLATAWDSFATSQQATDSGNLMTLFVQYRSLRFKWNVKLIKTAMKNMETAAASFAVYPIICLKGSKTPWQPSARIVIHGFTVLGQ